MRNLPSFVLLGALGWLAACSDPQSQGHDAKALATAKVAIQPWPTVASSSTPATALDAASDAAASAQGADATLAQASAEPASSMPAQAEAADAPPLVRAIDQAARPAPGAKPPAGWSVKAADPGLIRAEALLDRAGFSPGVIDGRDGDNLKHAVAAFAQAHGVASQGELNPAVWAALTTDTAPTAQAYKISAEDAAGPFIGDPPKDYEALSKLPALSYSTPEQMLSAKFHMDQKLLKALNPGADFGKAGTEIIVAAPRTESRVFHVARIEVDKTHEALRAYDAGGQLVAFYPATVGSTERPAPTGVFAVTAVAPHPAYYYDPKRLTFAPEGAKGKLKIAPGPNNPVGLTWIALTVPTYGIHGAPDPSLIGKRQSHGCVRLTNWDAVELGKAVKRGVKVDFVGEEKKT